MFYRKRRGPEWKQGWTGQTLASVSTPPPALLTIFAIVIVLLWLSQYTNYESQLNQSAVNFQLFLFLLPILLIFLMAAYYTSGRFTFRLPRIEGGASVRRGSTAGGGGGGGGSGGAVPWGLAIFVVLVLVLLSYQSSFHSKWFGPLRRSS